MSLKKVKRNKENEEANKLKLKKKKKRKLKLQDKYVNKNSEFDTTMSAIGREHLARGPGSRGPVFKDTAHLRCEMLQCNVSFSRLKSPKLVNPIRAKC